MFDQFNQVLDIATKGKVKIQDLRKMPPSQIMQLVSFIERVNKDFFEIAGLVGIDKQVAKNQVKQLVLSQLRKVFSIRLTA